MYIFRTITIKNVVITDRECSLKIVLFKCSLFSFKFPSSKFTTVSTESYSVSTKRMRVPLYYNVSCQCQPDSVAIPFSTCLTTKIFFKSQIKYQLAKSIDPWTYRLLYLQIFRIRKFFKFEFLGPRTDL